MTATHVIGSPEKGVALPGVAPKVEQTEQGDGALGNQNSRPPGEGESLPVQGGFDYGSLPAEIRSEAKSAADEIKSLMRHTIVDVGAALARIKERIPHGQWAKWLLAEFGLTQRSAQNYMAAAGLVAKNETVSVLQPKTLYLLASPSIPEAIRQTVIERFDAGEPMADRAIKEIIGKARIELREVQRRAEEVARDATLSPRARRSRAQRQAEREREEQEWERKRAYEDEATNKAADLLISHLPPDEATRLRDLLRNCTPYKIAGALLDRLKRAVSCEPSPPVDPTAPEEMVTVTVSTACGIPLPDIMIPAAALTETTEKRPAAAKRVGLDGDDLQPVVNEEAGDPSAPESPASEAPVNNDMFEGTFGGGPLTTLQKQYTKLSDRLGAYDWVMRRLSLGETPAKDDTSEVEGFVRWFVAAPAAIQQQFRADIGERPAKQEAGDAARL
jgi:Protein of unknown function (DUF3102)